VEQDKEEVGYMVGGEEGSVLTCKGSVEEDEGDASDKSVSVIGSSLFSSLLRLFCGPLLLVFLRSIPAVAAIFCCPDDVLERGLVGQDDKKARYCPLGEKEKEDGPAMPGDTIG